MRISNAKDLSTGSWDTDTVTIANTDDNSWITFTFSNGDNFVVGTTYYFGVVEATALSNLRWLKDEASSYANGNRWSAAGGSDDWELFTETSGADYMFRVNNP